MTFANPSGLAFLAAAVLVALLGLLRVREIRREVATLFLWRQVRTAAVSHIQRARSLLDPLLLLQVACAIVIAIAIAQPLWSGRPSAGTRVAILLDASASMRADAADPDRSRYAEAAAYVDRLLSNLRSPTCAVVALSSRPTVLLPPGPYTATRRADLLRSAPTWNSDAAAPDILAALAAVGGFAAYDRLVIVTDTTPSNLPLPAEVVSLPRGPNLAITTFAVRERPTGGISAFVEIWNGTDDFRSVRLSIADEFTRTTIEALLAPSETSPLLIPFPASRGTRFVAALQAEDEFPDDDARYAALAVPMRLRVHWIGDENRFLRAALEAVLPLLATPADDADLIIAYDVTLDRIPEGNALLVHSGVDGLVSLGVETPAGFAEAAAEHALLAGLHPEEVYVESMPEIDTVLPHRVLLRAAERPLLIEVERAAGRLFLLASDLYATNLAITVDFPLLVRNLVGLLVRHSVSLPADSPLVGHPVDLSIWPDVERIDDPRGGEVPLLAAQSVWFPEEPGFYTVISGGEPRAVAVNLDAAESVAEPAAGDAERGSAAPAGPPLPRRVSGWAFAAGAALAFLLGESFLQARRARRSG